jgi:hypothetical protein
MATNMPGFRMDGRLPDGDGETVESSSHVATHVRAPRWTAAHTEAARFLGECIGAGAVLGMLTAMARTRRGE